MAWDVTEPTGTGDFSGRDDAIRANFAAIETILTSTRLASPAALVTSEPYIKVSDVKSANTNGGTNVATTWTARVINTEDNDADGLCSISSNQITLAAGTYETLITSPFAYTGTAKLRLRNVTDNSTTLLGTNNSVNASAACLIATMQGRFTIAAQKTFEIQYYTASAYSNIGLGASANAGENEVYTVAEFRKIST